MNEPGLALPVNIRGESKDAGHYDGTDLAGRAETSFDESGAARARSNGAQPTCVAVESRVPNETEDNFRECFVSQTSLLSLCVGEGRDRPCKAVMQSHYTLYT
jgi:hypothetical protein